MDMRKQKMWIIGGILVAVILGMTLVFGRVLSQRSLEEIVTDDKTEITEQIAAIIGEAEKSRYTLDNCQLTLINAEGDRADCYFSAEWTRIRQPEEDPFIQGMQQAAEALLEEQEKEYAGEIIDGWIAEMASWPETEWIDEPIVIMREDKDTWALYYPYRMDGVETLIPLSQMAADNWTENAQARRQSGIDTINEAISWLRE